MIKLDNVELTISNRLKYQYNIEMFTGTCYRLIGESGAGKTTFIDFLKNNYKPINKFVFWRKNQNNRYIGKFYIDNKLIKQNDNVHFVITEQSNSFLEKLNIMKNLPKIAQKRYDLFEKLNIKDLHNKKIQLEKLSGGERRRLAFLRMLLSVDEKTKIIILDEPFNDLPDADVNNMISILDELKRKDLIIIFVTHNESYAKSFLDEIKKIEYEVKKLKLKDGKLILSK